MTEQNTIFPYLKIQPKDMKPLEQVLCMVYLAQTYSLEDLRFRQELLKEQLKITHKGKLNTDNLIAMQANIDASVAYQSFPNDSCWMSFIRQN